MVPNQRARRCARAAGRCVRLIAAALLLVGCGGGTGAGGAAAARTPARSGDVWEVDGEVGRAATPGALLAFVNGLHVMVLDGNTAYAGMTRLEGRTEQGGDPAFALPNGLRAALVRSGEGAELRFSTGEVIALRRQPERKSK